MLTKHPFFFTLVLLLAFPTWSSPRKADWLLLGVEAGFLNKSAVTPPEITNSGFEFGAKGIWSHYTSNWITDLGLGLRSDEMENNGVTVSTKAFFADASLRYRITERISLGPSFTGLLGQDVSYSDVGTNSDEKSFSAFLGGRALYDILHSSEKWMFRIGLNASTDLNIAERQVTTVQFLLEFGWPVGGEVLQPKQAKVKPQKKRKKKPLRLNLMSAGVRFASGSAQLVGKSNQVIRGLAKVLVQHRGQWAGITVEGHTDAVGDYRRNIMLSRQRAEAVKKVLVQYGVDRSLVHTAGYGPDQPLDQRSSREAYAKNRRVELRITGANAGSKFIKALRSVVNR